MRWKLAKNLIVKIVIHFPYIMSVCLTNKQQEDQMGENEASGSCFKIHCMELELYY